MRQSPVAKFILREVTFLKVQALLSGSKNMDRDWSY